MLTKRFTHTQKSNKTTNLSLVVLDPACATPNTLTFATGGTVGCTDTKNFVDNAEFLPNTHLDLIDLNRRFSYLANIRDQITNKYKSVTNVPAAETAAVNVPAAETAAVNE